MFSLSMFLLSMLSNACSSPAANQSRVQIGTIFHWYSKRNYQSSLLLGLEERYLWKLKVFLPSKPNLLYQWDISMVQLSPLQGDQERLGVSRSSYWIALLSFGQLDIGGLFIGGLKDQEQLDIGGLKGGPPTKNPDSRLFAPLIGVAQALVGWHPRFAFHLNLASATNVIIMS